MIKTILVIGQATRDQLQPLRLQLLHDGFSPKEVHVSPEELFVSAESLSVKYWMGQGLSQYDADWRALDETDEREEELLREHVGQFASLDSLVIVTDNETYERWIVMFDEKGDVPRLLDQMEVTHWKVAASGTLELMRA